MSTQDRWCRRRVAAVLVLGLWPMLVWAQHALERSVVGSGGTTAASGGGYTLRGTIAQPVAGYSSAGAAGHQLQAGFILAAPRADALFQNGFEGGTR